MTVLRGALLSVDQGGAVDLLEVAVREGVPTLGVLGGFRVDGQVLRAEAVVTFAGWPAGMTAAARRTVECFQR